MKKLSEAQQAALDRLRKDGALYPYNGVSTATVRALARMGLAEVDWNPKHRRFVRSTGRSHYDRDWVARPADGGAPVSWYRKRIEIAPNICLLDFGTVVWAMAGTDLDRMHNENDVVRLDLDLHVVAEMTRVYRPEGARAPGWWGRYGQGGVVKFGGNKREAMRTMCEVAAECGAFYAGSAR